MALTRDYRLLQKRRGHRYSVDDMIVAHLAATFIESSGREAPGRVLDLGCGLGSVLLITAWAFPEASLVGLEVLEDHVSYARRNVLLNGCGDRARVVAADLRDLDVVGSLGRFALVMGSPPYFAEGSGTLCADPARAAAHFELRGGIEEYAQAASLALAPGGLFVTCAAAEPPRRAERAMERAGLSLVFRRSVVPRPGKPPFLQLLVGTVASEPLASESLASEPDDPEIVCQEGPTLILRRADGHRTAEHRAIRSWTGL